MHPVEGEKLALSLSRLPARKTVSTRWGKKRYLGIELLKEAEIEQQVAI